VEVELRDLELGFEGGERPLLTVASRTVPAGSRLAIRGESGVGKTTLLQTIGGLRPPAGGDVRLGSQWLGHLGEGGRCALRRGQVGFVFQRLNILEHFTVLENIRLGAPGRRLSRTRVLEVLDAVGLAERADELAWKLSQGQQQRVAVARVLATKPSLILADEPTSALDDDNAQRVMDALVGLTGDGRTLLVATHDDRLRDAFDESWELSGGAVL
jgi:putative ABC transport system ATP-binding protein